jgi:hypothetical protein
MKRILFLIFLLSFIGNTEAGWFGNNNTNEVAFSSNTVAADSYSVITDSDIDCSIWQIWEKTGTIDIVLVTDGTSLSEYPKGNTLLAISEKIVWAGTVFSSRLNRRSLWVKGNTTTATILYSAEAE